MINAYRCSIQSHTNVIRFPHWRGSVLHDIILKSQCNYITSLGAYLYKSEHAFRDWRGDTISFIDSRYKQSKNRNLNTRFTSGKDHRIVSIQLRHIFSLVLYKETLRHQSPTIIVIYFSSSLTIYIYIYHLVCTPADRVLNGRTRALNNLGDVINRRYDLAFYY